MKTVINYIVKGRNTSLEKGHNLVRYRIKRNGGVRASKPECSETKYVTKVFTSKRGYLHRVTITTVTKEPTLIDPKGVPSVEEHDAWTEMLTIFRHDIGKSFFEIKLYKGKPAVVPIEQKHGVYTYIQYRKETV